MLEVCINDLEVKKSYDHLSFYRMHIKSYQHTVLYCLSMENLFLNLSERSFMDLELGH